MPVKSLFNIAFSILGSLLLLLFCWLMFQIIWPYTSGKTDIDFLLTKQHIVHLAHYRWAFYLHIFTSLFVLAAGLTQFSSIILRRRTALHRWVGKMYVFIILFISAPAAFVMSFYGNGGWVARSSFLILSVLWWWFTFRAYQTIRLGDVERHRHFMLRSYALTLSAITLRVLQFFIGKHTDMDPVDAYMFVAWASWVGNLVVAELMVRRF